MKPNKTQTNSEPKPLLTIEQAKMLRDDLLFMDNLVSTRTNASFQDFKRFGQAVSNFQALVTMAAPKEEAKQVEPKA